MAVPGSVRSPASAGTNKLLWEGRPCVRDAGDVLDWLGLPRAGVDAAAPGPWSGDGSAAPAHTVPPELAELLEAVGWEPTTLEQVMLRTKFGLAELHAGLTRLEELGWLVWEGSWLERRVPGVVR
jgi:DNA processing protein